MISPSLCAAQCDAPGTRRAMVFGRLRAGERRSITPRLVAELCGLERRTAWGGRDSIDHGPGGHDDLANAVAGVLVVAAQPQDFGEIFAVNLAPEPRRPVDWEAEFGWERWP